MADAGQEHELRFWGCQNPYGVMAVCMPCGYHELLGDGLTFDQVTERTRDHQAQPEADELRVRIHQHLRKYPDVTMHGIARVLKVNVSTIRRHLQAMERDGEASGTTEKRPGDPRPTTRWKAT